MDELDIRKYANLMNELGLTGLEVTENNSVVRLERTIAATPEAGIMPVNYAPDVKKKENKDYISIFSPMVGVFYAALSEDSEPFAKIGDTVKKGSILCIIEAMKLMNEIIAEQDGVIVEVCAKNGQIVDYGCELFRIKR